ncbi:DUF397 domain-containing protein [Streptomyces sp. MI02-7b]|uniref:DUF397 domain-containing protein n=1 Tax=Streptomyces sp. MI02-7b TaxID=462941 RepID=UPI0029BADBA7|nr:DUF397 domain-containing protein [Streptomyces sp. MI02-7b]MDX3075827.1 DUF397 domain-containing protein [Streptomyces sp. MI02-7b]
MTILSGLTAPDLPGAAWRKSPYSGGNDSQCVEVATNLIASHGAVGIRDSKNPNGPALLIEPAAFTRFITAVRDGRFDN